MLCFTMVLPFHYNSWHFTSKRFPFSYSLITLCYLFSMVRCIPTQVGNVHSAGEDISIFTETLVINMSVTRE